MSDDCSVKSHAKFLSYSKKGRRLKCWEFIKELWERLLPYWVKDRSNVHGVKYLGKELTLLCKKKLCHVNLWKGFG